MHVFWVYAFHMHTAHKDYLDELYASCQVGNYTMLIWLCEK